MKRIGKIVDGVVTEHPTHHTNGVVITPNKPYGSMVHISGGYFCVPQNSHGLTETEWQEIQTEVATLTKPVAKTTTTKPVE